MLAKRPGLRETQEVMGGMIQDVQHIGTIVRVTGFFALGIFALCLAREEVDRVRKKGDRIREMNLHKRIQQLEKVLQCNEDDIIRLKAQERMHSREIRELTDDNWRNKQRIRELEEHFRSRQKAKFEAKAKNR